MVNPLRGFISSNGRLFEEFDKEGEGIELYGRTGVVEPLIDWATGRVEEVTIGGDTVTVDTASAESFFERNADEFKTILKDGMSLQEKLLRLLSTKEREKVGINFAGLPSGIFEEFAVGGEEGKRKVFGFVRHFLALFDALENNGFDLPLFRNEIFQSKEKGYLQYDREEFYKKIVSENIHRLPTLSSSFGRPAIRQLSDLLIDRIKALEEGEEREITN